MRVVNMSKYKPQKGTVGNFFERLIKYIEVYDKDFINRIRPADEYLLNKIEKIANKKAPKIYKEFMKYMGGNDDNLIEELFGKVDENMTSSLKGLLESYQLMIWGYPKLFEESSCLGVFVDDFEGIELSLDIKENSSDPSVYFTTWLSVIDREESFYSKSLEYLLFQAVFYRYEKYTYEVYIEFYIKNDNNLEILLEKYNLINLIDLVNLFGNKYSFEKLWFSDQKHYIAHKNNASIYVSTICNRIKGFISASGDANNYINYLKDFFNIDVENIKIKELDKNKYYL